MSLKPAQAPVQPKQSFGLKVSQYDSILGRHKYVKENNEKVRLIDAFMNSELSDQPIWEVRRKIDGANFSVEMDRDGNIKFYSRNGLIKPFDNFMNYFYVKEALTKAATSLKLKMIDIMGDEFESFVLCGEIYGSVNKELKTIPGYTRIIGRHYYGDGIFATFFDIKVNGKFMSHKYLALVSDAGFDVLEPMFIGTLGEVLEKIGTVESPGPFFHTQLQSTICVRNGFDLIDDQTEEGIVVSTYDSHYIAGVRAMFKVTAETDRDPKAKAKKMTKETKDDKTAKSVFTDNQSKLLEFMKEQYVTEEAFYSAKSKIGSNENVCTEMTRDAIDNFKKTGQYDYDSSAESVWTNLDIDIISKKLYDACMRFVGINKLETT